jgi:hypothetical protein
MKLSKPALRLALLGSALTLCALVSQGRGVAATCTDGDTRYVFNDACCSTPDGILEEKKGQSCIFGVWTDNGNIKCQGRCPVIDPPPPAN